MLAVGVDGWPRGWVAVALRDGQFESAAVGTLAAILERYPGAAAFAVDVPIGLPESGRRACDVEARSRLGPRWRSVFLAPTRAALDAASYREALAASPGLSRQAWSLIGKIREAAAAGARLREVHPELSFAAMAERPMAYPKRSWAGLRERREVLVRAGIELPSDLGPANLVPPDDILDAAAAAWTATRIARGVAGSAGDDLARIWF